MRFSLLFDINIDKYKNEVPLFNKRERLLLKTVRKDQCCYYMRRKISKKIKD